MCGYRAFCCLHLQQVKKRKNANAVRICKALRKNQSGRHAKWTDNAFPSVLLKSPLSSAKTGAVTPEVLSFILFCG